MTPTILSRNDVLHRIEQILGLSATKEASEISIPMIAQAFRRAAHILAPCPRHELERAVLQSLRGIAFDPEQLASRTTENLDTLIAYGDILEMQPPSRPCQSKYGVA
jgi:hypothetical protein